MHEINDQACILLIEDNQDDATFIRRSLEALPNPLKVVADGEERAHAKGLELRLLEHLHLDTDLLEREEPPRERMARHPQRSRLVTR